MTFSSPEVRHSFHQLSAGMQVLLCAFWAQLAKQGKFIEITRADSEIIIRITDKAEALLSLAPVLGGDET
jgi:hypothetical protein